MSLKKILILKVLFQIMNLKNLNDLNKKKLNNLIKKTKENIKENKNVFYSFSKNFKLNFNLS